MVHIDQTTDAIGLLRAAMLTEGGRRDPYPYLSPLHQHGDCTLMPEGYLAVWGYDAATELMRSPQWGRRLPDPSIRATWQHWITAEQAEQLRQADHPDLGLYLQLLDGAQHVAQRMSVAKAFSPKRLAMLRDHIAATVHRLADRVVPGVPFDFVSTIAYPLPTMIIGDLIGVPITEHEWFAERGLIQLLDRDPGSTFENLLQAAKARSELADYVATLIEERRRVRREDLISDLIDAMESGEITMPELLALVLMMYIAGHSTTAHMLGNGLFALLSNPLQLEHLRRDPSLVRRATEEILRYDTMVISVDYHSEADSVIGGIAVPEGTPAHVFLGAANRDPDVFDDPDRFDLTRQGAHISFGAGPHYCLGAALARLESEVAFEVLLERFSEMELVGDPPPRRDSFNYRSYQHLMVVMKP
jgi:cytochrome P450